MNNRKLNKKIRDSTNLIKDFNEKNIDKVDINSLEHKKDFKNKKISENKRFDEKIEHKKSHFLSEEIKDDIDKKIRQKKNVQKIFKENADSQNTEVYDPLAKDLDNDGVIDRYDANLGNSDYFSSTYDVEKVEAKEEVSKLKNKRKNYLQNELFTRKKEDTHSKKVEDILLKSKENQTNQKIDDIDSLLSSKDKKLKKLKNKKDSLLDKSISKESLLNKGNKKMLGTMASSTSILSSYVSYGSDENVGAKASEESLDKVSKSISAVRRVSKNHRNKRLKKQKNKTSKLNHRIRKRKSELEYQEKLNLLKSSDSYQQKTFIKKFMQRKQMKKLIYQKYEITSKDRVKKKIKDILISSAKLVSSNAKKIGGLLLGFLILFMMIFQLISSVGGMFGSTGNNVITTSYLSDENVLMAINQEYSSLEYNLQDEIDSVESNYPNYDEYIINTDSISHNVHELLAYITSKYGVVEDVGKVKSELLTIFNENYKLSYHEEIEIRYRTEYYTYTDENGNEIEESTQVPYEYKKLFVTLNKKDMDSIIRSKLVNYKNNLWHYEALLETKGNMEFVFGNGIDLEIINNPNFGNPGIAYDDETVRQLFNEAEKHIGKRYVFGANGPANFDCSSFVCYSYTHSGIKNMPRTTAWGIYTTYTNPISPSEAKAGDIIFFKNTYNSGSPISHVGIYAGNGMMLHAGDPIQYTSINSPYWKEHFYGFGRPR